MRPVLLALLVAACGPAAPGPLAPPPPAVATCDAVGAHLLSNMDSGGAPPEVVGHIRDLLIRHCTDDGWSLPARQCFLATTTLAASDRCEDQLTPPQRGALAREQLGPDPATPPAAPPPPTP